MNRVQFDIFRMMHLLLNRKQYTYQIFGHESFKLISYDCNEFLLLSYDIEFISIGYCIFDISENDIYMRLCTNF